MTSEYIDSEERYAVFPFYLCLDVSQSMAGEPIAQVNAELPQITASVGQDPAVAEVIRFGIVTFSDAARTVLPLSDLALVEGMPTVAVEGRTSYAAAFEHLRRVIESDYHAGRLAGERWYRPAVLFVSDGRPTDPEERWRQAHRRLVEPSWRRRPNILAFGFGEAVPEILAEVAENKPQRAFVAAMGAAPSAVVPELMAGLVQSIVSSSASVITGTPQLVPPQLPSMQAIPVDELE
ncbi:MAG TPA: VWA domain-containing protein [Acidimicrobiales bacterium]|nr:VWA domain-containing protein [Acidimicrobiales bacterium]